jgi:hypothetical protein
MERQQVTISETLEFFSGLTRLIAQENLPLADAPSLK